MECPGHQFAMNCEGCSRCIHCGELEVNILQTRVRNLEALLSGRHLWLYFAELDYKYNARKSTDGARTVAGIARMGGKRLMLHAPREERA